MRYNSASERRCSPAWDGNVAPGPFTKSRSLIWPGCSAPRTHARSKTRTRRRHWLFLDADTQNGPPVHETAQHFSREYVPSTKTQNGLVTSTRFDDSHIVAKLLHCRDLSWWRQQQQNWEVNGNKWGGVHPARFACKRWEQDFDLSYGRSTRDEGENAINVSWKALEQSF